MKRNAYPSSFPTSASSSPPSPSPSRSPPTRTSCRRSRASARLWPPRRPTCGWSLVRRPEPRYSEIAVYNAVHERFDKNDLRPAPDEKEALIVTSVRDLPQGVYTVVWKTVSALDGHNTGGSFAFVVGTAAPRGAPAVAQSTVTFSSPKPLEVVAKWLSYLSDERHSSARSCLWHVHLDTRTGANGTQRCVKGNRGGREPEARAACEDRCAFACSCRVCARLRSRRSRRRQNRSLLRALDPSPCERLPLPHPDRQHLVPAPCCSRSSQPSCSMRYRSG